MAELTTQTIAAVQPRAQNRVLKKFLANKSAVMGAVVVGFCAGGTAGAVDRAF